MLPSPTPSPGAHTPVPILRRTRPSFRPPTLQRSNASLSSSHWSARLESSQSGTPPRSVHEDEEEELGSSQESSSSGGSFGSQRSDASGYETQGTSVSGTQQGTQGFRIPPLPKREEGGLAGPSGLRRETGGS